MRDIALNICTVSAPTNFEDYVYDKSQREIHVQWWHLTFKYYYWLLREESMKQAGVKFSFFTAFNHPYPNLFSLSVFLDKGFWKNELYNSILCLFVGFFNVKTEFLPHVRIISDLDFFHINNLFIWLLHVLKLYSTLSIPLHCS